MITCFEKIPKIYRMIILHAIVIGGFFCFYYLHVGADKIDIKLIGGMFLSISTVVLAVLSYHNGHLNQKKNSMAQLLNK